MVRSSRIVRPSAWRPATPRRAPRPTERQVGRPDETDFVVCDQTIENGLHYRRDVTFREDTTRLTCGHAGRVMAILNNLLIGLLRWRGHTNLAQARRFYDGNLPAAVALVTTTPSRL